MNNNFRERKSILNGDPQSSDSSPVNAMTTAGSNAINGNSRPKEPNRASEAEAKTAREKKPNVSNPAYGQSKPPVAPAAVAQPAPIIHEIVIRHEYEQEPNLRLLPGCVNELVLISVLLIIGGVVLLIIMHSAP